MSTSADIDLFGKKLNIGADGYPDTVIKDIIEPVKKEIDKKMEEYDLPRTNAVIIVLEDWAPAYDPYGSSRINRGPRTGHHNFSYKANEEGVTIKIKQKDKKIKMDWEEIDELEREEIRNKYK